VAAVLDEVNDEWFPLVLHERREREARHLEAFLSSLVVLSVLLVAHFWAASRAPVVFAFRDEYIPLDISDPNGSVDVDLTLSKLDAIHRFVAINCSLVRARPPGRQLS
jgi:hypothetical protein